MTRCNRVCGIGQFSVFVYPLLDALFLQAAEDRLRNGVVPAIASPARARFEPVGSAEVTPIVAAR